MTFNVLFLQMGSVPVCAITILMVLMLGQAATSQPVTMAGFGERVIYPGSNGDTWDFAWSTDGTLYSQNNDGYAFNSSLGMPHDVIATLAGSPEIPASLAGRNVNPGGPGDSLAGGPCYSSGIHEVDGVLYHNVLYSDQIPGAWVFHHVSTMKSADGGVNWTNRLGQTNVWMPNTLADSSFPNESWRHVNFVKYGAGGVAPAVDNAQSYVYLVAAWVGDGYMLGRVLRTDLPSLDRSCYQFYTGGDGMEDVNWTSEIAQSAIIGTPYPAFNSMVYNPALGRYLLTSFTSDSWASPPVESTLRLMEAPHPWGPWSPLIEENVNHKESDNLTWTYLVPKFTAADGRKMWMSVSGRAPYGLQFIPVYLSTSPVQVVELEAATLTGVTVATDKAGYLGVAYVTGFDVRGDEAQFIYTAARAGTYLVKLRYNTSAYQSIGCYVNGNRVTSLKLGKSEQNYATWTEYSLLAVMTAGSNSIAFRYDDLSTGKCNLDSVSLAFYSANVSAVTRGPWGGLSRKSPGTVEAEDYDTGGEGIAYCDTTPSNLGGAGYRNDAVDIQSFSGGYCVCWIDHGEWLEYTVDIPEGLYNITARVASAQGGGMGIRFKFDAAVLGTVSVPVTGGWYAWQNVTLTNVFIPGGGGIMRLEMISGSFNVDSFTLTAAGDVDLPYVQVCSGSLDAGQVVGGSDSVATGSFKVLATEDRSTVKLEVEHTVAEPTLLRICDGGFGTVGTVVLSFENPVSPFTHYFTKAEIGQLEGYDDLYVDIVDTFHSHGAIRGQVVCVEDGCAAEGTVALMDGSLRGCLVNNDGANGGGNGLRLLCHADFPNQSVYGWCGLNFEHIFNGVRSYDAPYGIYDQGRSRFSPRKDPCTLVIHSARSASLIWTAEDSAWGMDTEMRYTVRGPHYVDLECRLTPRKYHFYQGWVSTFWASYMNHAKDRKIYFYGMDLSTGREGWITWGEDLPQNRFEAGVISHVGAPDLPHDPEVYSGDIVASPKKKFVWPFYFGLVDGDGVDSEGEGVLAGDVWTGGSDTDSMVYMMMFDQKEPVRFCMWNWGPPYGTGLPSNPAWDWEYVIVNPAVGREYTYRARLVFKRWKGVDDVVNEYKAWLNTLSTIESSR
ncbi:MAG: carbohydrate-binding protein [Planctomycetes bacterium]|jgi:hypothetical protein|nr:carbohydrate-binding protein [Planctomycetota bacterium]